MRTRGKVALVATGYIVAVLVSAGVVALYVTLADSPDRQASSGMYAFGDSLLFLAVFGVVGGRSDRCGALLSPVLAPLIIAATGVIALVDYLKRGVSGGSTPGRRVRLRRAPDLRHASPAWRCWPPR
jgi:hypothetical protein